MSAGYTHDTKHTYTAQSCMAVREVLSRVGDKWSVLLVSILYAGPQRFNGLRRDIEGISQRMLTLTLRELERDGLVSRRVEATVPPSVYYALTPLGETLYHKVRELALWAQDNIGAISDSQQSFDARLKD